MDIEQISADGIPLNIADTQARQDITEIKSNLTDLEDYSTDEVAIGKWFVDGKTIYRKCFTLAGTTGITLNSQAFTDTTIAGTNIQTITRAVGVNANGFYQPIGATTDGGAQNYVRLYSYRSVATYVKYLVLEYTKVNE